MNRIIDEYGRTFKTLRVSLLNRCNLGCIYCTSGDEPVNSTNTSQKKSSAEKILTNIAKLHALLQLETIRLTGGEPLLYTDLIKVIEGVKAIGISNIKLTTNGFLLEKMATPMRNAGMRSINVSLDAVDEDVYFLMSKRNNVQRIMNGIDAAIEAGLAVKINAVIMKGINDSQVLPLLEYAFSKHLRIRFLEVMAMGHLHQSANRYLFSQKEILELIASRYSFEELPRTSSSTSEYWRTPAGNTFGIIANESEPFCHDCNRLRLDSDGNIFGCLSNNHPISLSGIDQSDQLVEKLKEALSQKQAVKFVGSELSMLDIGG